MMPPPLSPRFAALTKSRLSDALLLIEEFYREEFLTFERATVATALEEILAAPELGQLWLIETGAQPIGYFLLTSGFILEFGGRQFFLDELYVRPEFRQRGVGRNALTFIEIVCRERGVKVLRLEVECDKARTVAFYERFGFRWHERRTMTRLL